MGPNLPPICFWFVVKWSVRAFFLSGAEPLFSATFHERSVPHFCHWETMFFKVHFPLLVVLMLFSTLEGFHSFGINYDCIFTVIKNNVVIELTLLSLLSKRHMKTKTIHLFLKLGRVTKRTKSPLPNTWQPLIERDGQKVFLCIITGSRYLYSIFYSRKGDPFWVSAWCSRTVCFVNQSFTWEAIWVPWKAANLSFFQYIVDLKCWHWNPSTGSISLRCLCTYCSDIGWRRVRDGGRVTQI